MCLDANQKMGENDSAFGFKEEAVAPAEASAPLGETLDIPILQTLDNPMHPKSRQNAQILVQSPDLRIPLQSVTFSSTTNQTLSHFKRSLFPKSLSSQLLSSFYFTLNGKPLSDDTPILNSQIPPFSTLIIRSRFRGGGGDGGATGAESRDCYLNMYAVKKPDKVDPNEQRLSKWLNCALSNEPLREPCVVDKLGNIFNKEALVEALLGKKLPKEFGHIKGLKDMVKIQLSLIPGTEDVNGGTRFQCPIAGLEFNGKYKFFALKNCGHVLSAKALKEVKSSTCLVCHKEFSETDKIVINGNEEEVAILRERMEEEKAKTKDKKARKIKNGAAVNGKEEILSLESSRLSGTKHGIDAKVVDKASAKVEGNGKVVNGNPGLKGVTDSATKRFKAVDIAPPNANKEVYASIFTSSRKSEFKETYSCRSLPLGRN
ncbi:protein RTF2-like protein [Senna tora]|uniref:Protein RTF2-like protein n=1 Tax=Senna tora TaxID=362788 RepID=A0A834SNP1_9FABA|nr:protein RTF2-like protein [Senna tora]